MDTRFPSVPLITCDPYFSVWSPADRLYDRDTVHWTGRVQRISGLVSVDDTVYRFMGLGSEPVLTQTALELRATSSRYCFEGAGITLEISFLSPLLLDDLDLLSRPVSYIGVKVAAGNHRVAVTFAFDGSFCKYGDNPAPLVGGTHALEGCRAGWLGQRKQAPLSHSGDDVTIDWGYLYLAVPEGQGRVFISGAGQELSARLEFPDLSGGEGLVAAAYDDLASINYFGETRRAYWAREGKSFLTLLEEAVADYEPLRDRCTRFDAELNEKALASGGTDYQRILSLAYRQTIAAHKLITDEHGELVFISKECFSNGCAATVDVSYPSVPLYLLYNPELVKGMLRPILRFARQPVWTYDFAPHDAGRYPYVTGQVYGLRQHSIGNTEVYPPFYAFPANSALYDLRSQMPVEECGNMLIMMAAVAKAEGNVDFSRPHFDLAKKWVRYLIEYGEDPGEQLCTDDFAGHLAHNCNLAAKAIMGIEAYAILLDMAGDRTEAGEYHAKAQALAAAWIKNTRRGDHTALVFDREDGWSLKYNLIWDKLFGSGLFDPAIYETEIRWYLKKQNPYGVPLDSRREYTKSDWILWVAAFTDHKPDREALIKPVAAFLRDTPDRVPFSDWYDTLNAKHYYFQNRTVQGGLFMVLLADAWATAP
ncbi:DUF4965 domain-containing protein [Treponema sp. TIM-1]|uniref:glutaminase domain-containing protein n=1 Tax=Treponema sp. TIM-1 TaxID=2898417 RepID=UPI0039803316